MSDTTDLIEIPRESALEVFSTPQGLDPYLAKIRAEIDAFQPDTSNKKGRDAIASIAYKVAKIKTALDGVGKDLVADLKEMPKKIDASRKEMREKLDAWKDEVRAPLTAWEEAEQQRVAGHEQGIAALEAMAVDLDGKSASDLRLAVVAAEAVKLGEQWEEYETQAARTKERVAAKLHEALVNREKYEAEQVELAKFRAAEVVREQKEREQRIAREAAERAQKEAEAKAKAERDAADKREADAKAAADKRELELKLAAEKAEREKLEAQQREEQAKRDSDARATRAAEAERQRIADEQAQEAAATAAREADKKHKAKINNAALAALVKGGMPEDCAKQAITLIAKGLIPAIKISY